ncbi:hypothetical protein J6590_026290 [Homalodisca vitripennis]|nr:hypothetical protein J6590_026290 [Homalodisca vitripennis]
MAQCTGYGIKQHRVWLLLGWVMQGGLASSPPARPLVVFRKSTLDRWSPDSFYSSLQNQKNSYVSNKRDFKNSCGFPMGHGSLLTVKNKALKKCFWAKVDMMAARRTTEH